MDGAPGRDATARCVNCMRRCGRKNPKTRLQAIGDVRVQIEELISGATEEAATPVATQPRAHNARFGLIVGALSLVIAALAIPATLYFRRDCHLSRSETL